jgi:hypothetical protein
MNRLKTSLKGIVSLLPKLQGGSLMMVAVSSNTRRVPGNRFYSLVFHN